MPANGADEVSLVAPSRAAATPLTTHTAAPGPAVAAASPQTASGGKLDVNTASSAELLPVPGIGPVLAQRIIERRPYASADDLINVKGIGPKNYQRIREHFH